MSSVKSCDETGARTVAVVVSETTVARKFNHPNQADETDEAAMTKRVKQHKKWNRRFKIFFCCVGYKRNKDNIADVASIFAEFFADLNAPSSDLAAGFVLLSKYQAAQRQWMLQNQQLGIEQYLSTVPITAQTNFVDISTAQDSHLINDLIYYMNYSIAIFGWPLQMVEDPCMLCCIYPYLRPSSCCGGRKRRKKKFQRNDNKKPESCIKNDKQEASKLDERGCQQSNDGLQQEQQQHGSDEITRQSCDENNNNSDSNADSTQRTETASKREVGQLEDDCKTPIILEDNFCGCNAASVERRLASHHFDIIYATYRVDINVIPFLVVADHSKQTIVVALRGSMSLSDMVTDMNGVVDKLPIDNCPDDWHCHRGATRAALYVKSTLIRGRVLETAFNCRPDLGSQNYNLILCGHSLGAGVAAILGILMRPLYPTLRAYLHSPPGGMLSLAAVEYTKKFATGILLGNDCVPSLGIAQMERLRYHMLLSRKSSQKPTRKILAKAICPTFCFGGNEVEYDPRQSLNLLYGTEGRSFDYNGSKIPFQTQPEVLYVPGRLIHIVKNFSLKSKTKLFFNDPIYQAVWSDNTRYDRILIGEGMFFDHLPNNLMHAMKMLFSKTLPARKESEQSVVVQDQYLQIQSYQQQCNHIMSNGNDDVIRHERGSSVEVAVTRDPLQQIESKVFIEDDVNNNINDKYDQSVKFDYKSNNNNSSNNDHNNNTDDRGLNIEGQNDKDDIAHTNSLADGAGRLSPTRSETMPHAQKIKIDFHRTAGAQGSFNQTSLSRHMQADNDDDKKFDNNGNDDSISNKNRKVL